MPGALAGRHGCGRGAMCNSSVESVAFCAWLAVACGPPPTSGRGRPAGPRRSASVRVLPLYLVGPWADALSHSQSVRRPRPSASGRASVQAGEPRPWTAARPLWTAFGLAGGRLPGHRSRAALAECYLTYIWFVEYLRKYEA